MKIRISHFPSSVCAFILALIILIGTPMFIEAVKSDPTKPNGADMVVPLYFLAYLGVGVFLYIAFMGAKYYILTEEGIFVCLLGIRYRKVKWDSIFDAMIGPDPLQKYRTQTLLLNCQPGKKYRPQNCTGASMYEKSLYKDLFRGQIICLRCGKNLDSVLMLLNKYALEDVVQKVQRF